MWSYFRKEKFDIVHTNNPKPGLLGQLAAKIAGVPIIVNTVHGFYFHEDSAYFKRKFGNDHPNASLNYRQGDIVTSLLKTKMGKTLVINYDMQLPRPYSNRWLLQGTKGVYDEEKSSIYLDGESPEYQEWELWKPFEKKYNHKWWQADYSAQSHNGTDYVMLSQFIEAVKVKGPTPVDVYDSAVMTAIVELSGISIAKNSPVPFPDFTKGKWETNRPYFAMDKII